MDTLGTGDYLLAAHEGIVGVGQRGIGWIEVGVERSSGDRVVSKNVEICIVFFEDEAAKGLFICCAGTDILALQLTTGNEWRGLGIPYVFICRCFDTCFIEHLDTFREG